MTPTPEDTSLSPNAPQFMDFEFTVCDFTTFLLHILKVIGDAFPSFLSFLGLLRAKNIVDSFSGFFYDQQNAFSVSINLCEFLPSIMIFIIL